MCPACNRISENIESCDKCGSKIGYIGCGTCSTVMNQYGSRVTRGSRRPYRSNEFEECKKRACILIPVSLLLLVLMVFLLGGF